MQDLYDDVILIKRAGDVFRLLAIISLLLVIWHSKKSTGVSGKSQVLYAIVYTTRYIGFYVGDVIYINAFELVLRITLISASYFILYLIYNKFKYDSSRNEDSFRIGYLLVPCAILALFFNPGFTNNVFAYEELRYFGFPFVEVGWAFSYYVEAVAIVPQLLMLHNHKIREKQDFIAVYLLTMGISRLMYTIYSIYEREHNVITDATGAVQFCTYLGYYLLHIEFKQTPKQSEIVNIET